MKDCILFMGTYPPRECGIATFTRDLTKAFGKVINPKYKVKILAMNRNKVSIYNYPKEVILTIDDSDDKDYVKAAKEINKKDYIKAVSIQHEFGIFGGKYGEKLIQFVKTLNKPYTVTFHSVLPNPDEKRKKIVQAITKKAICVVVMNELAIDVLRKKYYLENDIKVIPHGIHYISFKKSTKEKARIGHKNNTIFSTFGLLNPNKGIEYVIESLTDIVKEFPEVIYLIVGETHPNERKKNGEKYRNFLEKKVKKLGLQDNVKFYNKYLSLKELLKFLQATDVYIAPCLHLNQITSGTIAYAMGTGRVIISTPTMHARNAVTSKNGFLVELRKPESYSKAMMKILSDPSLRHKMSEQAYDDTRHMLWSNVAENYKTIFEEFI